MEVIYEEDCKWERKTKTSNSFIINLPLKIKLDLKVNDKINEKIFIPSRIIFERDYNHVKSLNIIIKNDPYSDYWSDFNVNSTTLNNEITKGLKEIIENGKKMENIIFNCYQSALEILNNLFLPNQKKTENSLDEACNNTFIKKDIEKEVSKNKENINIHLIFIDHMRDYKNYLMKLTNWSNQLNLDREIIYKEKSKQEMIKGIYLILKGENKNISEFLSRLRTHKLDSNSKGKPCKERMSKSLFSLKAKNNLLLCKGLDIIEFKDNKDLISMMYLKYKEEEFILKFNQFLLQ